MKKLGIVEQDLEKTKQQLDETTQNADEKEKRAAEVNITLSCRLIYVPTDVLSFIKPLLVFVTLYLPSIWASNSFVISYVQHEYVL